MKLRDGRPRVGQDATKRHYDWPYRAAQRAGILGAALALGGTALAGPGAASAAVTGGQHGRPAASPPEGMLQGVAVLSSSDAWAVGIGLKDLNLQNLTPFLSHWDGKSWTQVTGGALPIHGYLDGIVAVRGGAWAVGASGTHPHGTAGHHKPAIMRLTGSTWTRVPYPNKSGGHLKAVAASSPSNVWAVGSVMDAASEGPQLVVHWNGKAWTSVRPPAIPAAGFLTGVATTSPDNVWAVGNTDPGAIFIEHWNGKRWTRLHSPGMTAKNDTLVGVAATSARNAWAVGSSPGRTLILHWNGRTWKRVPSPSPGGGGNSGVNIGADNRLGAVTASSATNAWAVGWGSTRGLVYAPVALHWNGRRWTHVPTPDPSDGGGFLQGIGLGPDGHAWAVGYTEEHLLTVYEHWNGSAWH